VVNLWNDYAFVRERWKELSPETQLAVGLSFWKRDNPDKALKILAPLIHDRQVPEYSELAMSLALSIYVDNRQWKKVKDLGEIVQEWEISPEYDRELKYALALAHENLGEFERSREIWTGLGDNMDLDPEQRAYAIYFMARDAVENRDLKRAYDLARESLSLLMRSGEDTGKILDNLRILIDVSEASGRPTEALKWAMEYEKHLDPEDPGWPALKYRMASLYRKAGDPDKWRSILEELREEYPETLYGRMSDSDLQSSSLEQAARQYAPMGNLQ
jgi:hypothetical protein